MDVDNEENGTTTSRFLRIKVRIDIRSSIMHGVILDIEEACDMAKWCPLKYEFLPEFCYTCGIIGHIDRNCSKKGVGAEEK